MTPNIGSQTKSNQNWINNICHCSALVGQLGRSENSRSHLKLILFCFFPDVIPLNRSVLMLAIAKEKKEDQANWMKNTVQVQIFEIFDPQNFLENPPKLNYRSLLHGLIGSGIV